jgi:hypothetical protein
VPGQEISLFPRYSSKENRTTNYTMLLVRLLYEESPSLYQLFLDALLPESGISALPRFEQQKAKKASVPDGYIAQRAYTIYFETKTSNWFYDEQLRSHLRALADERSELRALIALSPFEDGGQAALNERYQQDPKVRAPSLRFRALSFSEFLECVPELSPETQLARIRAEYEAYLAAEGLLSSWQSLLDVVNCATWPEHFTHHRVYTCPTEGASYSHRRSRYLGLYKGKRVSHVAEIRGVVRVPVTGRPAVMWANEDGNSSTLIKDAVERSRQAWGKSYLEEDRQVFVLGEPFETNFVKRTKGGMIGSKQYFDLKKLGAVPASAGELAAALRGRPWGDLL